MPIPVKTFLPQLQIQDNPYQKYVALMLDNTVSAPLFDQIKDLSKNNLSTWITLVYLDVGQGSSDSATLAFTFSGTYSRFWDIKITQIPCNVNYEYALP